ncbi:MAG: hypothetical protein A2513_05385 [Sulfurimonas sp. RIFOXYD12_FULL_33_39]|uniref:NAD-dependent epimerase/dehydratase family protein n=1 Tax=unclassified Sulfurimonas TaxID=2623549 RepID=UPI0008BDF7BF|nr:MULTISPECIES: NAD-dependent epimerase/dehydratase family protein [unclassified Sulfurimonas]OHE10304.1 MAG: hypothetical protein A2513_05385 [Sulfurimonas sp. RIFOXYD12_FULL_33_39]OHE13120.1 MAG: hypothetical protein A2530_11570 [Sulfurimonas sp. RIFOXYD2_FULL_34_21]DAB28564.1 MAG TPA: hypothetical protein CFH78_01735 [Sulfurimonas sp. UBA10385]
MKNSKTILLVGSEGFLGRHLGNLLNSFGYDIIGIDIQNTSSTKYLHFINKNMFELLADDISFLKNIDSYGLIYTAGVSRNGIAASSPIEACHNTATSLIKLLELLNEVLPPSWMMITSTREVDILLNDEISLMGKQKIYSTLKLTSELMMKSYQEHWNIPLKIFRLSDIFGIGDHHSKVMQIFFNKAIRDEEISVQNANVKLFLTEVSEVSYIIYEHVKTLSSSKQTSSSELIKLWNEEYYISLLELAYLTIEFNQNSKSKILTKISNKPLYPIKNRIKPSHIKVLYDINNNLIQEHYNSLCH